MIAARCKLRVLLVGLGTVATTTIAVVPDFFRPVRMPQGHGQIIAVEWDSPLG